jgi:hypothetical protein
MSTRTYNDDELLVDAGTTARTFASAVWLVIGAASIGWGMVALADSGINTSDLSDPHRIISGFNYTPLLSLCEIGFGALLVISAFFPAVGRFLAGSVCAACCAFGAALIAAGPASGLHQDFGVGGDNGWIFVVVGAVGLLAALGSPITIKRTVLRTIPVELSTPDSSYGSGPEAEGIQRDHWWHHRRAPQDQHTDEQADQDRVHAS